MKNARIRLGQEILRRRKAMGMTQEELASRMCVSRQSVAKWETGLSSPDIDRLVLLRDVLQTSLDDSSLPQAGSSFPNLSLLRKTACARHLPGPCATAGSFP